MIVPTDEPPPDSREAGASDGVLEGARLVEALHAELRAIAGACMRGQRASHTLQPTALVNEAYLRLARAEPGAYASRAHFLAVAATAMRQILINHAEAANAAKRGGGRRPVSIESGVATPDLGMQAVDVLAIDEALRRLAALDERKAQVVEARIFGGLTHEEIARALGVSLTTVEGDWRFARAWLAKELRASPA